MSVATILELFITKATCKILIFQEAKAHNWPDSHVNVIFNNNLWLVVD